MKTIKKFTTYSVLLFAFLLLPLVTYSQNVGDVAPDFSYSTLAGSQFTLSEYRGKVVFIFVFGYACPHCLANGNNTETGIYNIYKSNPDFVAVGVDTWGGNASGVSSFKISTGLSYPLCLKAGAFEMLYVTTYDRIIVVDREGIIRYKSTAFSTTAVVAQAAEAIGNVLDETDTTGMMTGAGPLAERPDLRIYPVPARDHLIVESPTLNLQNASVTVLNSLGRIVSEGSADTFYAGSGRLNIPVSHLAAGIYFIRIRAEGRNITRKFQVVGGE